MKLPKVRLNSFQYKEIARYWFDLSKLTFVSLILKFFEPSAPLFTLGSIGTMGLGLTAVLMFGMLGLRFSKEIKL